jgi:hypothetical protein
MVRLPKVLMADGEAANRLWRFRGNITGVGAEQAGRNWEESDTHYRARGWQSGHIVVGHATTGRGRSACRRRAKLSAQGFIGGASLWGLTVNVSQYNMLDMFRELFGKLTSADGRSTARVIYSDLAVG